jgi:hypothetical protein
MLRPKNVDIARAKLKTNGKLAYYEQLKKSEPLSPLAKKEYDKLKKYQTGSEVKGSKGGKASQIIAGISAAAVGAAGIGKNISNRRKAKKAAEEKAKIEAQGKENPLKSAGYIDKTILDLPNTNKGYSDKQKKMKTGGMVNSNTKVSALKSAGSKGVKSGVNSKVSASKVAKGRTGGTSSAPKTATPKAKMGGNMKKKSC